MTAANTISKKDLSLYFPEYLDDQEKLNELFEYQKDLDILAQSQVSIQFNNKGKDHAVLVMSKIFQTSDSHVKIFASNFNGDISDNKMYLDSLSDFLDRSTNNKVEVIFEHTPKQSSKALALLKKRRAQSPNQVELKQANAIQLEKYSSYIVNEEKMIHFAIGNDQTKGFNKYRCETDTKNYIAILNFDDVKFCDTLNKMYAIINVNTTAIS